MRVVAVTPEEAQDLASSRVVADLSDYLAVVEPLVIGTWNKLELDDKEKPNLVRRRLNMAARKLEKSLTFRKPIVATVNGVTTTTIYMRVGPINHEQNAARAERAKKAGESRKLKRVKILATA